MSQRVCLPNLKSRRNAKRTGRYAQLKSRTHRRLNCEPLESRTLLSAAAEWASGVVAFSSQYGSTTYSAAQALAAPDTTNYGDKSTAWAPKTQDGTTESLTLSYATPLYASGIRVRETCGNGFVTNLEVRNAATGAFESVWAGTDTTPQGSPNDLTVTFAQRSYLVDAVRVTTNTSASTTWEEIDAVELSGETTPAVGNLAPTANAGLDQSIAYASTATLSGTATDDGLPTPASLTTTWTTFSGPGTVTFANAAAKSTTATFSAAGSYVLRLTASDGSLTSSDDMAITISAPPVTSVTATFQNGSNGYTGTVDTRMNKLSPKTAYATATTLFASGTSGSLLRWNLSSIPAGALVTSAKLTLNVTDLSTSSYELYQTIRPWAATTATWNKATSSASWQVAGAQGAADRSTTPLGSLTASTTGKKVISLNSAGLTVVNGWIANPTTNTGFTFQDYSGTDSLAFSSAETPTVALRPKLEITYTMEANAAPVVSAGLDRSTAMGTAASLDGTVADDGLPNPPAAVTQTWTKVSGPGNVTFANAAAVDTTANFSAGGTYVLRLTASDGAASAADDMTVTVAVANAPPVVNAGADKSVTLPSPVSLVGSAIDDGQPGPLTTTWSKISGLGTVTFANAAALSTTANFSAGGTYVLRLTASDGAASAADDMTVTVAVANAPPVVNAGADQSITLPATASLDATVTDDGQPNPVTAGWTKVSGPGTVTFASAAAVDTTASFSAAGSYVLRLTASDGSASAADDVAVTVSNPTAQGSGIWISKEEIMALPMTGTGWATMVTAANQPVGVPSLANPDDQADTLTLARALVGTRTGNQAMIDQARASIMAVIGTEVGGESIGIARNLNSFVIAADIVGLSPAQDAQFRSWMIQATRQEVYTDGRTMDQMHDERPNNWGLMAGATRATVAVYLGDQAALARTAQVFKGWMGDRTSYADFKYGDLWWQLDEMNPVGVLPKGAVRDGHNVDGLMPEEMRRGDVYTWPPVFTGYVWEALQGAFATAEVLTRAGFDPYNWQDKALLRSVEALDRLAELDPAWKPVADDAWVTFVINDAYGTNYAEDPAVTFDWFRSQGKVMAWTAWTHQDTTPPADGGSESASSVIAFSSQYSTTTYSASQALGSPDTAVYGDAATAWAPSTQNGTTETLTLGFTTPRYASAVTVRETCGNGFVTKVEVRNKATGAFESVWSGTDTSTQTAPVDFKVTFATRSYLVDAVRVTVNTNASTTWEEIDSVELTGPTADSPNSAPVVNAGLDRVSSLLTAVSLDATVTDDGLPNPLVPVTTAWTMVSGPGTVTFANAAAVDTTANFSTVGSYVLRLTASDGLASGADDVTVSVGVLNTPPVVNAGVDKNVTFPGTASLDATVTDDALPNPPGVVTTTWSKVSGPGTVSFANAAAVDTTASFSATGSYVLRLTASDGSATAQDDMAVNVSAPVAQGTSIWISTAEIMALPMSGTAWTTMVAAANQSVGTPSLANPDSQADTITLAKALVGTRTGNQTLISEARTAIMAAIGTEAGGESIGIARNLNSFVIAANIVGLSAAQDAQFRSFLVSATRTEVYTDGRTMDQMHDERPNNWGLMAGATRATVARYLGDTAAMDRVAQVFKGWLGDRTSYADFKYGDLWWQLDESNPVGVLPKGSVRDGHNVDGLMPEEMRRGDVYTWPPVFTGYVWEALQGAVVQAEVLYRAGYDAYNWQDKGLLRAVQGIDRLAALDPAWAAIGDDQWQLPVYNARYGTTYTVNPAATQGKVMAWTAWTHQNPGLVAPSVVAAPSAVDAALALDATAPKIVNSSSLSSQPLPLAAPSVSDSSPMAEVDATDYIFADMPTSTSLAGSSSTAEEDPLDAIATDLALPQLNSLRTF